MSLNWFLKMFLTTLLVFVGLLWQLTLSQSTPEPVVDLGYARYQGRYNETYGVNVFKGYGSENSLQVRLN